MDYLNKILKNIYTRKIYLGMILMILCVCGNAQSVCAKTTYSEKQDGMVGRITESINNNSEALQGTSDYTIRKNAPRSGYYTPREGIDVSRHQGYIDWNKVKGSGITFAFVRVGYRGLDGQLYEDDKFRDNLAGATAAGIKVGAYIYSEATSQAEAIEEANFVIGRVYNYKITLPIVIDYEYCGGDRADRCRLLHSGQSKSERTAVCAAFCNRVKELGYTPCVYANKNTLQTQIDGAALANSYKIWVAQYYYQPNKTEQYHSFMHDKNSNYDGVYDFWQFSSQGQTVAGISSKYVDCDYWFDDGTINGKDYSGVFDAEYYATNNPGLVKIIGSQPATLLQHFVNYGIYEGRKGSAEFSVQSYKNAYPDLRAAFGNNIMAYANHYTNYGRFEGRTGVGYENTIVGYKTTYNGVDYSSIYNYNYYVSAYPDIKQAFGLDDARTLEHFVKCGMNEGRQGCATFNVRSYKNTYSDLRKAFNSDLKSYYLHYISCGRREGRVATGNENNVINPLTVYNGVDFSAVYDYNYYISNYSDLKSAFGSDDVAALEHFVTCGMNEGRKAKADFDVRSYRNTYSDLRTTFGNDKKSYYMHYIIFGRREGRTAIGNENRVINPVTVYNGVDYSSVYDYNYYISKYSDLKNAFGNDDVMALKHFVTCGMNEGRQAKEDFKVHTYRNNYNDLQQVYGSSLSDYYLHYIYYGKNEGRIAN